MPHGKDSWRLPFAAVRAKHLQAITTEPAHPHNGRTHSTSNAGDGQLVMVVAICSNAHCHNDYRAPICLPYQYQYGTHVHCESEPSAKKFHSLRLSTRNEAYGRHNVEPTSCCEDTTDWNRTVVTVVIFNILINILLLITQGVDQTVCVEIPPRYGGSTRSP